VLLKPTKVKGAQGRAYAQLTREQRYQIYALLKAGHNQTDIAHLIKVHKSTISRELRRNCGLRGYRPKQAHQFALNRRKKARYRIEASIWILIEALTRQDWSPEQVSDWLRENYGLQTRSISTFSWINMLGEIFIATYDARKSAESAMGATTAVASSSTG
jgi:IS30 family transposase